MTSAKSHLKKSNANSPLSRNSRVSTLWWISYLEVPSQKITAAQTAIGSGDDDATADDGVEEAGQPNERTSSDDTTYCVTSKESK